MARIKTVGYTPARGTRRWMLGGIAAALVVFLATGAFFLGRATMPDAASQVVAGTEMPLRDGIPIPDRHSVAGAATAAENFQIAGFRVSAGTLDPAKAAQVLLSPQAEDNARSVLTAPTANAEQLSQSRTTYAPLSVLVQSYTADRAEVQVWGVAATSHHSGRQPAGTEDWGRATITLTWDGAQWRVSAQRFATGPWPVRADSRLGESQGDFSFRATELKQHGWSYVPEP